MQTQHTLKSKRDKKVWKKNAKFDVTKKRMKENNNEQNSTKKNERASKGMSKLEWLDGKKSIRRKERSIE